MSQNLNYCMELALTLVFSFQIVVLNYRLQLQLKRVLRSSMTSRIIVVYNIKDFEVINDTTDAQPQYQSHFHAI